jgi:uncharacterized protein
MCVRGVFRGIVAALVVFTAVFLLRQPLVAQEMMRVEPVTIITSTATATFSAEIADTEQLQERGLMFRHILPEDQAMLFDFGEPRPAQMWMKDTNMSLDMLFVRENGTIAALAENTVPRSLDTIGVQEPVRGVIELAAGTVKRLGIHKNDQVVNRIFSNTIN